MSSKEAFLQTILENPDDDAPRLIYADWLEEQSDVRRAEFIRIQCELARLPEDDEIRRPILEEREWTLLSTHASEWMSELPVLEGIKWDESMPLGKQDMFPKFERGFANAIMAEDEKTFHEHASVLFQAAPITELRFNQTIQDLELFFASTGLERLTRLGMSAEFRRSSRDARLLDCPRLSGLRALDLGFNLFQDEAIRFLIDALHLKQLTELCLDNNDLSAAGIRSLTASPLHLQLQLLSLAGNHIGDAGARELLSWPSLTSLVLNGNEIGPRWVSSLVASPLFARLRWLSLPVNNIGNEGVRLLANCSQPTPLNELDLSYNGIGPSAIAHLARATWLTGLKELGLDFNPIGSNGAKTLAGLATAGRLPNLKILDLQFAGIENVGGAALIDSPLPDQLEVLVLTGNRIRKSVVSRLRDRMGDRLHI